VSYWTDTKAVVTGGHGFLGRGVVRLLDEAGADVRAPRSSEHDLRDPSGAEAAIRGADVVIHLAANVGGIGYNLRNPAALIRDNTLMGLNVYEACRDANVDNLIAVCSVCAYPKVTPTPFSEQDIWNGFPEESNAPYGVAKRLLLVLSDAYRREHGMRSSVPVLANLYGPGDNFDLEDSHVIAAMIHKYVVAAETEQPQVVLWGTGAPSREFLYVDDAAQALLLAAEHCDSSEAVNIGTGTETRIADLATLISDLVGYGGETVWDSSRPDGQSERYLNVTRARELIGFEAQTSLERGLRATIEGFRADRR